jgi:hypothetical protein
VGLALLLFVGAATSASGATISTQVNPFGVPAVGTGIALFADTDGTQAVTALNWLFTGNIVNNDAPGSVGFLNASNPPPILQSQSETVFADFFDPFNAPWGTNDSYWGNFFTAALLGAGFNGSGTANPGGVGITTMELVGGTTFGFNPSASELLVYLVITAPIPFSGELAVGAGTLDQFSGILNLDGSISQVPEPSGLVLLGIGLVGFVLRRRR